MLPGSGAAKVFDGMSKFSDWLYNLKQWWLKTIWWPLRGRQLDKQIAEGGKKRDEAEEQLARIIYETGIRPDAVSATVIRGGPTFLVKHQDAHEAFIHNTYTEAADKAIAWIKLQDDEIKPERQEGAQMLNRQQRRAFKKKHKQGYKKGRKKSRSLH